MMSINEIKNYTFQMQRGGNYRSSEVENVFGQVKETLDALATAYEKAKKENDELYRKIASLSDKIEEYKRDEDSIHAALVTAQRMADQVVREAKEKAAVLVDEAQAKADETINAIKGETDSYVQENKDAADAYLEKAKTVYDEKLSEVEEKAQEIVAKANSEAELVIKDAEMKADEIIAKANLQSDEITSNANAKIENAKKKLADLMALTAEYKSGVIDVLNRQIALFETINVEEQDYAADYYPQSFHIDSNDVYHPEFTAQEYEADAEVIAEEVIEAEQEEAAEEIVIEEITIEEIAIDDIDEPEIADEAEAVEEVEEVEEVAEAEEIEESEEAEAPAEEAEAEEAVEETEAEASDIDYYEELMKKLAEESKDIPAEPIEARSNNIFTSLDLAEGLEDDDEDELPEVELRTSDDDDDDAVQLEFGSGYNIFDDDDSQGSFFGRFKKK